jgi:hypothetical protein
MPRPRLATTRPATVVRVVVLHSVLAENAWALAVVALTG